MVHGSCPMALGQTHYSISDFLFAGGLYPVLVPVSGLGSCVLSGILCPVWDPVSATDRSQHDQARGQLAEKDGAEG